MRRLVFIAALSVAGCNQPPLKEVAAAAQQVEHARAAGAERYAPERWKDAETALALAQRRIEGRDYRGALSAAHDAAESARLAIQTAAPAKVAARSAADVAIAEVRLTLDRASVERTTTLKAGVPRASLTELDARWERATRQIAGVLQHVSTENLPYIEELLAALRTDVTPLPDLYRDARTEWEAKHPRRARGGSSKPR